MQRLVKEKGAGAPGSHTMELPRLIVIGEKNLGSIGEFLVSLAAPGRVSLVSGDRVRRAVEKRVEKSLESSDIRHSWHKAVSNDMDSIGGLKAAVAGDDPDLVLGVGGGRAVDLAKMVSHELGRPFASVPTAASHDGIASPFVSIRGERPHSVVATAPLGVFVDIDVIQRAPERLLASGCGDLVANITAVRDWRLGARRTGEYYGSYAAELALMSARMVIKESANSAEGRAGVRVVVEALISAGVASCIAGSSRPCSGAEHLFSHALDKIAPGAGLHGEKCGLGAIMITKLYGGDWKKIAAALSGVGAPVSARQAGIKRDEIIEALCIAQSMRPERYTILHEKSMTEKRAAALAESTRII